MRFKTDAQRRAAFAHMNDDRPHVRRRCSGPDIKKAKIFRKTVTKNYWPEPKDPATGKAPLHKDAQDRRFAFNKLKKTADETGYHTSHMMINEKIADDTKYRKKLRQSDHYTEQWIYPASKSGGTEVKQIIIDRDQDGTSRVLYSSYRPTPGKNYLTWQHSPTRTFNSYKRAAQHASTLMRASTLPGVGDLTGDD